MWPVVTDGVAWSLSQSVVIASTAKTAELIEMSFGLWTVVGPSNHVLDGGCTLAQPGNTMELSTCVGDAALCQIPLTTCYGRPM